MLRMLDSSTNNISNSKNINSMSMPKFLLKNFILKDKMKIETIDRKSWMVNEFFTDINQFLLVLA